MVQRGRQKWWRPTREWGFVAGVCALYAVAMLAGRSTHLPATQLALAWPAAGVSLAWFVSREGRRDAVTAFACICVISGVVNQATGVEPVGAWLFGPVNALHGLVGAVLWRRARSWPSLAHHPVRRQVAIPAVASVAGAAVSAIAGGVVAWLRFDAGLLDGVALIGLRNALSSFIVANALISVPRLIGSRRQYNATDVAVVTTGLAATFAVQLSAWPLAFVALPAVLLVAIRLGSEATWVFVAVQGFIVVATTVSGRGSFSSIAEPGVRAVIAQGFMLVVALVGVVIASLDRERERALRESQLRRQQLADHMEAALVPAAHVDFDADLHLSTESVNEAMADLLGRPRERLVGSRPEQWFAPEHRVVVAAALSRLASGQAQSWRGQVELAPDHRGAWVDLAVARVTRARGTRSGNTGSSHSLKLQMIDITAQREAERRLAHAALHDELTGLANRTLLARTLDQGLRAWSAHQTPITAMYVDVDHFKSINDTRGHRSGDAVLSEIARRLRQAVRSGDLVARLGGDEFVVLCGGLGDEVEIDALARRVQRACGSPIHTPDGDVTVSVSCGIATAEADDDADTLMRRADDALYRAKRQGRARSVVAESAAHEGRADDGADHLVAELGRAVARCEFDLLYQPIVEPGSGAVVAVEALLRWHHPHRGVLRPAAFMEALESTDMIHVVGGRILHRACADAARLNDGPRRVALHVNVSARELARTGLAERVRAALTESGLDPALLVLEITETRLLVIDDALLGELDELRADGVRIAMDDFGTGYSSLTHLVRLPVDIVKLDRSFVASALESPAALAVTTGVLALANGVGIDAIAEGVETPQQAALLHRVGYHHVQGFHFGRPASLDDVVSGSHFIEP